MGNQIRNNANQPERRRTTRTPYPSQVRYFNASVNGAGTIRDISSDGMFMETRFRLNVGDQISIAFQLRNSKRHMDIEGEIARRTHGGAGVKFLWP